MTAENFPTSHFESRSTAVQNRKISPMSLRKFPLLPDSKIVIINQKTTACQPERAHSTEKKNVFPLKNIQILSTKKMRENRAGQKKLIEKRFWFIGYTKAQQAQRSAPRSKNVHSAVHSLIPIALRRVLLYFQSWANKKQQNRIEIQKISGSGFGSTSGRSIAVEL